MRSKLFILAFLLAVGVASLPAAPQKGEGAAADAPKLADNPNPANDTTASDQEILRSAGLATDAAGLVAYLRKMVLTEADRAKVEGLVQQLGSDRFAARE